MEKQQTKPRATRKLKGFDFDKEGAAVALVGPSVGGPANGIPTLITKANNFSPEFIKKMQQVQVTMELPDFLEKFFYLWDEQAEVLATMMGYVAPVEVEDEQMEAEKEYGKWIEDRFTSFSIIKSLHTAENLPTALSKLTEQEYLSVLNDQVQIEKALKQLSEEANNSTANTSTTNVEKQVEASASKRKPKDKSMTQQVEMVEKSVLLAVEKAAQDTKVQLEKALAKIDEIEAEKKQAIVKSKTDAVQAVLKDEKQAQAVLKAALALDNDEDFNALIDVVKSLSTLVEKSNLFKETGAGVTSEEDKAQESQLAKVIKSKYHNQSK